MRSFNLWCYCVQVVQTVQWHNLSFLHSPKFRSGGDICGLQLWVLGVMLCYSHAYVQAALQTLLALWAPEQLQFRLFYIRLQKLDKLLASSPPQLQQITVRMFEGCQGWSWWTAEKKFGLLLALKRWCTNWKVSILRLISSSLPSLPPPRFLCQKQWQKYLYVLL